MEAVSFFVPGLPVAQPRQRVAVVGGRARNYTPGSSPVHAFKAAVRLAWPDAAIAAGPVKVWMAFTFPRPKSKTRKTNVAEFHTTKPDVDNLFKSVADALTGLAWRDDSQIAVAEVEKFVAGDDCKVGVWIRIWSL